MDTTSLLQEPLDVPEREDVQVLPEKRLLQLEGDESLLGEGPMRRMLQRVLVGQEGAFEDGARRRPRGQSCPSWRREASPDAMGQGGGSRPRTLAPRRAWPDASRGHRRERMEFLGVKTTPSEGLCVTTLIKASTRKQPLDKRPSDPRGHVLQNQSPVNGIKSVPHAHHEHHAAELLRGHAVAVEALDDREEHLD